MDNMERRQDERHDENTRTLRDLSVKIDPLLVQMRQVVGDENYRGRMGLAEDDIRELNRAVKAIDKTIAKWSGGMIVAVMVIEVLSKLFERH
jgi:hypothetical protein